MTEDQKKACEALAEDCLIDAGLGTSDYELLAFDEGYQAAQSPDQLLLNPLVKGLIEALEKIHGMGNEWEAKAMWFEAMKALQSYEKFKRGG